MNSPHIRRANLGSARGGRALLSTLALACASLASLSVHASIIGISGVDAPCTVGSTTVPGKRFELEAREGRISAADGASLYVWGYAEAGKPMQYPGPTLLVSQGTCVTVALTNQLPARTSIIFPGQGTVDANGGGPQGAGSAAARITREVAPPRPNVAGTAVVTSTITYSFVASEPGTYMYQSGSQAEVQTGLGMVGALIVRPVQSAKWAYGHAATAFDHEKLYMISEMDPARNQSVEDQVAAARASATATMNLPQEWRPDTSGWAAFDPQYWFVNGRTAPDTLAASGTEILDHQPYNALARIHAGERLLMRAINAGRDLHPMHHHGNHSVTIARDGRMLSSALDSGPDLAVKDYTLRMVPGQTMDAIWTWSGKGLGWDISGATCDQAQPVTDMNCPFGKFDANGVQTAPGVLSTTQDWTDLYKPLPTRIPAQLELTYGEMFSGSPYLGAVGMRPVGAGLANNSGGYWHMFHSHNEREIINYGVFPGGMMTMLLIEPWYVQIND